MRSIILEHFSRYPRMQAQDAVKLLYQSEFAGGHLIDDPSASLLRLEEEYQSVQAEETTLFTPIGGGLYRLALGAAKARGLLPQTINRLFVYTAKRNKGSMEGFMHKLSLLSALCDEGLLPIASQPLEQHLSDYRAAGCPALNHSTVYREAYAPHYRVVDQAFKDFWQVFDYIDHLSAGNPSPICVAIEGNSASYKSTLSALLRSVYDCNIIPMDHFFLQPHQRTAQRLSEIGGNIDYQRFGSKIADHLPPMGELCYRPYSCQSGSLQAPIALPPKPLTIVEGVYSMHPLYVHKYQGSIFLHTDRDTQRKRILRRNGPEMLGRFDVEWIPMEDRYFNDFAVKERCGIAIDTSNL